MAIASPINLNKVSSGIKSLNTGMGQLKKSADTIKTVTLNKTRVKRESIARNRMLSTMREEAVKRKDQESIIEASGIGGAFKRTGSVIADSTKGFLGRLLDFASSLLIGWLLYNLPTIMTAIEDLITRIKSLYGILTDFMSNIKNTFQNFGSLLSGVYQDIIHFDFTDQSKRVQSAMDDLGVNLDAMHDQFEDGFKLLTTPLGQGPGETPPAPLNTDYTQPAPTTGDGGGGPAPSAPKGAEKKYAYVYELAKKYGDPFPEVTAAQSIQESGHILGQGETGKYNIFGQTARKGRRMGTPNDPGGGSKTFADYSSYDEAVKEHVKLWVPQYGNAKTPYEALMNIQKHGGSGRYAQGFPTKEFPGGDWMAYVRSTSKIIKEQGSNPQRQNTGSSPTITNKATAPSKPASGKGNGFLTSADLMKVKSLSYAPDYKDWYGNNAMLNPSAAKAFLAAQQAYGKDIPINSAYRSYEHQRNVKGSVKASPGYSRHGLGLALDFEPGTPSYNWMMKNGPKYGWYYAAIPGDPYHFEYRGGGVKPAQVSSPTPPGQNVPSVAQNRKGQQIIIADNPQQPQPQQVSSGGSSQPQMIPIESSLNSLIKNQILLELAYT